MIFTFQTLYKWRPFAELDQTIIVNINLSVSANAYDGDHNEQDEDHDSTADGNTKPDVYWSFLCETFYCQQKSYSLVIVFACITLSLCLSLRLPIFNDSTADVSFSPFFQSSHVNFPLCSTFTSGMDKVDWWRLRPNKMEQDEQFHFTSRSEVSWCPNVHVRFTLWPSYTREPPEEETNRRRNLESLD